MYLRVEPMVLSFPRSRAGVPRYRRLTPLPRLGRLLGNLQQIVARTLSDYHQVEKACSQIRFPRKDRTIRSKSRRARSKSFSVADTLLHTYTGSVEYYQLSQRHRVRRP